MRVEAWWQYADEPGYGAGPKDLLGSKAWAMSPILAGVPNFEHAGVQWGSQVITLWRARASESTVFLRSIAIEWCGEKKHRSLKKADSAIKACSKVYPMVPAYW